MNLLKVIPSTIFFLITFISSAFSQNDWQWLNPKPESNIYSTIHFYDSMRGIASSSGGTILITSDGGITWNKNLVKSESIVKDAVFIDSNKLMAVVYNSNNAAGSILISRDLGTNWKILNFVSRVQEFTRIKFLNPNTGFILSASGSVMKTTDKCVTWKAFPQRFDFSKNSEIMFTDNQTGFINTQSGILKTIDCGNSWSKLKNAPGGLTSLYCSGDILHGVSNNNYYSSSNSGNSWVSKGFSFSSTVSSKIRAYGNMLLLFFGSVIYKSIDNGISWVSVINEDDNQTNFLDGEFLNGKLILSGNGLYSFEPQSGIFQPLLSGIRNNVTAGKSVTSDISFAVGKNGLVMKTVNRGKSWDKIELNTKANLSSIIIKGNNIHIAGDSGVYFYSSNLGLNWTKKYFIFPSGNNNVNSLYFLNESVGIAAGNGGYLKVTTNGGQKWFDKNAPSGTGFFKYVNSNFLIGVSNSFYKSSDNGSSWISYPIENRNFYDINFINEKIGFVVSDSGIIYKTVNGGINWNKRIVDNYNTSSIKLNKILFLNSHTGYCIGNEGRFYYSTTGGETWTRQILNTASDIEDIESISWKACMLYGDNGLIMKNDNVTNAEVTTIAGKVKYNDNLKPVLSGHVKAVNYDYASGITMVFDSSGINSDGTYILRNVRVDSSYIVAYPNSEIINDFIPTYYPSAIMWMQATLLYTTTNLENIDIAAHRIAPTTGSSTISGNVFFSLISNPVSNVTIAAKLNNNFAKMDYSTSGGAYTLNSLSPGNYKIYFDKLGYKNDSLIVSLIPHQSIVVNINLNNAVTNLTGEIVPTEYVLYQNYPNPFNPATKIEFDIPKSSFVKLIVYDVLGREVSILLNKELTRGKYSYSWNAHNTPSGIYFCKLQTQDYSSIKKMLLIK